MGAGNQGRAAVGGRNAVLVRAMMKAAPISLSAWANPGADDGECGTAKTSQWSSLLAPQRTSPVSVNDLRGYSMFAR